MEFKMAKAHGIILEAKRTMEHGRMESSMGLGAGGVLTAMNTLVYGKMALSTDKAK